MNTDKTVVLLTLGGLTVLSGVVVYAGAQVVSLDANIKALVKQRNKQEVDVQQYVETTVTFNGNPTVIRTPREKNEDGTYEPVATWKARHAEAVAAFGGGG
jgi:deoxyxylulose-5-phosphate synthase